MPHSSYIRQGHFLVILIKQHDSTLLGNKRSSCSHLHGHLVEPPQVLSPRKHNVTEHAYFYTTRNLPFLTLAERSDALAAAMLSKKRTRNVYCGCPWVSTVNSLLPRMLALFAPTVVRLLFQTKRCTGWLTEVFGWYRPNQPVSWLAGCWKLLQRVSGPTMLSASPCRESQLAIADVQLYHHITVTSYCPGETLQEDFYNVSSFPL